MEFAHPHRLTPIALGLLLACANASAQAPKASTATDSESAAQPERLETFVVTGFSTSLFNALKAKRDDNGIVDVIKSEDIGKFPDTNLAESLQRVPGVVITRDAGEGRNITVRGLGPAFTRVRINGLEASATTGGTDSSGGNNRSRAFDFNVFASELFNSITVRKSATADVDEGSLGATVDLQTARPFDYQGRTIAFSAKERYNDQSKTFDPRVAFLASDRWANGKVGALFSAAYTKRRLFEEGFSTVRWDNGPSAGGFCAPTGVTANPATSTATTCGPAEQGVARLPGTPEAIANYNLASDPNNFHPRVPRYGRLTHDQDRLGLTGAFQMRPTDQTLLTFEIMYSKIDATREENYLGAYSFGRNLSQGGKGQTSVVSASYAADGSLRSAVYNGVDIRSDSRFDKLSTEFTQPTITLEQDIGESLKVNAKLGRADSKFRNPIQTTTTLDALNVNGYQIDFSGNRHLPAVRLPFDPAQPGGALTLVGVPVATSGTQPVTVPNTLTSAISIRPQGTDNRSDVAQLNFEWFAIPDRLTFKFGPDYKKYSFDTWESRRVNQNDTIFAPPAGTSVASLTTTINGFGSGLNLPSGTPTSWVIPNLNAIAQAYNIYCNCIVSGPSGGPGDFTLTSTTNGNARGNNQSVSETDTGGWLQADFSSNLLGTPLRGNVGVRYVQTKMRSTGYQAANSGTEVTIENTYSDLLPSANVAIDVTKDFVVRLAAAKVMSRPPLSSVNPGGSFNTAARTITMGNPLLKPYRANTVDASFEWYFNKNSIVNLGLFQKNISTYIQTLRVNVPYNQTGLPTSLLPSSVAGSEIFQVTTPVNTDGGKLTGFELNYQQPFKFLGGPLRHTGLLLNYTQVKSKIAYFVSPDSDVTIDDDLLNLSPKSYNATLYYDDGRFSARVSGAYRSAYLTRVPGSNNNDVEGTNKTVNVDASISYKWNDQLEFTLEGVNLSNQANDQFVSRARNSVVAYTFTGREYVAGLRYKF